jgi:hypothetical protein
MHNNKSFITKAKICIGAILASVAITLSGCNGDSNSTDKVANKAVSGNANATEIIKNKLKHRRLKADPYLLRMGGGYDKASLTGTSGQSCLLNASNPDNIYIANPKAKISFDQQSDMSELENALNVNVSGSYGGDRFGVSAEASFANSSKNDAYTTNALFLYQYSGKAVFKDGSLGHGMSALTPEAAAREQTSPTEFRAMCGNSFIEQMDGGATLAIRLSLSFNSHRDQELFNAKMEGHYGLANIATKIEQAAKNANVHIDLKLSAIQEGGEPQKLADIFGELDEGGDFPMIKCQDGLSGSTACTKMIDNIISYAQTMKNQLAGKSGGINLQNLYYSNPTPTDYANLGIITQGAADPSDEILAAMRELTSRYDKAMYDLQFTTHYLTALAGKLDDQSVENLNNAAKKLNDQIHLVFKLPVYKVSDCYKGYVSTLCLDIRKKTKDALALYELKQQELNLVTHLENDSYAGKLINYYGGANPTASDYRLSDSVCILAPISDPILELYALNCDGKWLDTGNKNIKITAAIDGSGIVVSKLSYLSISPTSTKEVTNAQWITYKEEFLPVDVYYDNYFYFDNMYITAPQFSTSTAKFGLVLLSENQV